MSSPSPLRLVFALLLLLGLLLGILFVFVITDYAFSVWAHLQQSPDWFAAVYIIIASVLLGLALWFISRALLPRKNTAKDRQPEAMDEDTITLKLQQSSELGIDVAEATVELEKLQQRRSSGEIHIALLGEINAGKSSLIKALLPDAEVMISPRGGETQNISKYQWQSPAGDKLILSDLPGLNEVAGNQQQNAREEAIHAHVVIYVCDGDLTQDQWTEVQALRELHKPLIIALNKIDQFTAKQQQQLTDRLNQRLQQLAVKANKNDKDWDIVAISSGGEQELIRQLPDGSQQRVTRPRPVQVEPLGQALQKHIDRDEAALSQLRDAAVFVLTQRKLDAQLLAHRNTEAERIVKGYTRKAVVGAMAAVAPGSDVLIQGYLGISLVRDLCALHQTPAKQIDIDRYLSLVGKHVGKTLPLLLAISGNALKAFPGLGTLGGGVLHAIAYGLIFDSLGRAVHDTLETRGALRAAPSARHFEDSVTKNLGRRSKVFARMLLEEKNKD